MHPPNRRRRNVEARRRRHNRQLVGLAPDDQRDEVLVAEGDSWFAFPGTNVIRELRYLGYSITSVANSGDTIASMASGIQAKELTAAIKHTRRDHGVVHGILLSGGGNELMASGLGSMLLPKGSDEMFDESKAQDMIATIQSSYESLIADILSIPLQQDTLPPAIFVHGYDYPIPDGRGIEHANPLFALADALPMIELPGPWMAPQFKDKGYSPIRHLAAMTRTMATLVDHFNAMLQDLASRYSAVHHIDLRSLFPQDEDYAEYWHDELHPTRRGFRQVMVEFDVDIQRLVTPG